jgi:surface protein
MTVDIQSTESLQEAVNLWCSDRPKAEAQWGPISQWNVSNIADLSNLFRDKADFNDDISDWDVRHVTNMSNMFSGAMKFNQPLYKWKISAETNRENMFAGAVAYKE